MTTINTPETNTTETPEVSSFIMRNTNDCMAQGQHQPAARMLFSEFWREGELAVLFGDAGIGKSILASQIADSISRGEARNGFKTDAPKQKVLYVDFDTTDAALFKRYSYDGGQNPYRFDDNLVRVSMNREFFDFKNFSKNFFIGLEKTIQEQEIRVLIVDSLNTLKCLGNEVESLKQLKKLQVTYKLSVLLVAETRKPIAKTMHMRQIAGSKILQVIADSVFALGCSTAIDSSLRYIVQLKGSEGKVHKGTNVLGVVIGKKDNFMGIEMLDTAPEHQFLFRPKEMAERVVIGVKYTFPTASYIELAEQLNVPPNLVKAVLDKYGITYMLVPHPVVAEAA